MCGRVRCAARGSLRRDRENAVQGNSRICEFHAGIVRVELDASNAVLSRWKIAGDFCDLVPGNESLSIARWSRADKNSILRNDRWLRSLERHEEHSCTHSRCKDREIKNYANHDKRK